MKADDWAAQLAVVLVAERAVLLADVRDASWAARMAALRVDLWVLLHNDVCTNIYV